MASRLSTSPHNDGSRTVTITDAAARPEDTTTAAPERGTIGTLHLRAGTRHQQQVAWDEDVVDNEGCGRKSSKICCIYHKPRNFDESSSEESSSESDSDAEHQQWRHARHPHQHDHNHHYPHHPHHHHQHDRERHEGPAPQMRPDQAAPGGVVHQLEQDEDRNAYEIMPSAKGKRKAAS